MRRLSNIRRNLKNEIKDFDSQPAFEQNARMEQLGAGCACIWVLVPAILFLMFVIYAVVTAK